MNNEAKKLLDWINLFCKNASNPFDRNFYIFLFAETENHIEEKDEWEIRNTTYFPWNLKSDFYDEEWMKKFMSIEYGGDYAKSTADILQNPKIGLRGNPKSPVDLSFTDVDYWTCIKRNLGDEKLTKGYTKALQLDYEYKAFLRSRIKNERDNI